MLHNYSTLNVGTIDQFTQDWFAPSPKTLILKTTLRYDRLRRHDQEALDSLYSSIGEYPGLKSRSLLWSMTLSKDRT